MHQPPNNPDINVLDLGLFNAIQTLQYQTAARNIDELIDVNAFSKVTQECLSFAFAVIDVNYENQWRQQLSITSFIKIINKTE